jgi:hypothetical protein
VFDAILSSEGVGFVEGLQGPGEVKNLASFEINKDYATASL